MWCKLPPLQSIFPMGSTPPGGPWSLRAGRFQAPLSWEWFYPLLNPQITCPLSSWDHTEKGGAFGGVCPPHDCFLFGQSATPLPQGRGPGYTMWPVSTPQPIEPGQTPDPSQASWALCLGNPSLGLKAIDFKQCFGVWLEPRHAVVAMWPVLQRAGHERGTRRAGWGVGRGELPPVSPASPWGGPASLPFPGSLSHICIFTMNYFMAYVCNQL